MAALLRLIPRPLILTFSPRTGRKDAPRQSLRRMLQERSRRTRPNFSNLFQGKSKLFQGNSKLFQAFSKEFQRFSLAVSSEIKGLAAAPAILPRLAAGAAEIPSSRNRARRAPSDRPPRPTRYPSPTFDFKLPPIRFFRKEMSRALRSMRPHHTSARRPPWREHAAIVKGAVAVPQWSASICISRRWRRRRL